MRAVVFSGPSLDHESVRAIIDAERRPPVKQGDIYRVARQSPDAIGVIDGYFQGVPAVWHKEILWAMSQGTPVFGGASMGALRAAELDQFGMHGVGRIYEQFRDGVLEDDDEVALVHGPAELGYKPITLPMVNVRATLARGAREGVISPEMAVTLTDVAKAIFIRTGPGTAFWMARACRVCRSGWWNIRLTRNVKMPRRCWRSCKRRSGFSRHRFSASSPISTGSGPSVWWLSRIRKPRG